MSYYKKKVLQNPIFEKKIGTSVLQQMATLLFPQCSVDGDTSVAMGPPNFLCVLC
jgi:hypothetical protein